MKNKIITVTIGIPAYNEEKNIGNLLFSILNQTQSVYSVDKIIVASDGSTDETVRIVKNIRNPLVKVIENSERKGKPHRLNQLIKNTNSDVLVILDADILLQDQLFLEKLIKPIIKYGAELTSAAIEELEPKTFIQKILKASMGFKKNIFENYNRGNNLYTCHGRARAFSRKLYDSIDFGNIVADDAFSYLFCKIKNYKYYFAKDAKIFYKLPETFADHEKQSVRFFKAYRDLSYRFSSKIIKSEYYISKNIVIHSLLQTVYKHPIILLYFPLASYIKIKSLFVNSQTPKWNISKSSKLIEPNL